MAFQSPEGLLLGLGLLGLGFLLLHLAGRAGEGRLGRLLGPFRPKASPLPLPYLLGLLPVFLALGRPEATLPWRENATRVVILLDTSHSMAADDETPTRLERAKALVRAFLRGLDPTVGVGLVSFSGQAALVVPPGPDRTTLLEALEGLRPQGPSALGQGLGLALRVLGGEPLPQGDRPTPRPKAAVLLLSDGAANAGPDPLEGALALRRAGIPLFVRPLGSPEGAVSEIGGRLYFVPANPRGLLALAQAGGGLALQEDFRPLYQALPPTWVHGVRKVELTQGLLVLGFLLLATGGYLGLAREGRLP